MAIKIIKSGRKPMNAVVRFKCLCCGCVFDAEPEDYKFEYDFELQMTVISAPCPTCGAASWCGGEQPECADE